MAGEIGVMFNIPQPFTVRTKRLSQVVRISHNHLKQVLQADHDDGKKIISNYIGVWIFHISGYIHIFKELHTLKCRSIFLC